MKRILVNEGRVTLMLNTELGDEHHQTIEYLLRAICCTITGVELSRDWSFFNDKMNEVTKAMLERVKTQSLR